MIAFKVIWIISLFGCDVLAVNPNSREKTKTQGRQAQSFFPQQESSNPNFQGSPSDVYFTDGNNHVQDVKPKQQTPNPKFSPNLQADLNNQQYGPQQQQQQQQQQLLLQQQQLQQQKLQYKQQIQYQQQSPYTQQAQSQYANPSRPFYPTPDGNEVTYGEYSQQQYSPQSQQYVDNNNYVYTDPTQYQSQPDAYDQGFSQVVSGSYLVGERPQVNVLPQQRPTHSLYSPNQQAQYGGASRPIYQSQQNYQVRPPPSNRYGNENEGGFMQSISNFFNNIGQSASDIFSGRPPVNQYNPPPSVGAVISNRPPNPYNQQFGPESQSPFGSNNPLLGGANGNPINQFSKAIEEITRNDDYQCIPKVICQMVGSQRRQPSILNSPIFTAIISAVPSTSAGLVYGRAALLGLISGEYNCHTAYPRCPRNEEDLLYYLNNHRGGFFRFFNGGAAFGEDQNSQYNPNHEQQQHNQYQQGQYQQNQYQQNQYQHNQYQPAASNQNYQQSQRPSDEGSVQSSLASLQNIAEVINNSGGINLSNLGANANLFSGLAGLLNGGGTGSGAASGGFDLSSLGSLASLVGGSPQPSKPSKAPLNDQGQSLTELVGNLLTGFVGQRFVGRKANRRSKRSIDETYDNSQNSTEVGSESHERKLPKKISAFKLKLAASKGAFKFPVEFDEVEDETSNEDEIEGRILNKKPAIYSDDVRDNDKFVFGSIRDSKNYQFMNRITGPTPLPTYASNSQSPVYFDGSNNNNDNYRIIWNRRPKVVKFQSSSEQSNSGLNFNRFHQQNDQESVRFESLAQQRPSKMIFPDRTGTGNLRFDHAEFGNQNPHFNNNRYGKILTFGTQQPQNGDANRVSFDQNDRYSSGQQNYRPPFNNNNYQQQNQNSYYNQNYPTYNRYTSSSSHNQRDDNSSQNIYVTNGEGKIVYYINAQGKKVYV